MKRLVITALVALTMTQALMAAPNDAPNDDLGMQRKVGGYFDTEFIMEEDKNSTLKAHRFILEVGSQLNDRMYFDSEIEFEYGAYVSNSDDATTVQQGEIKIEQAWFDYKLSESLTQRTGIILVPFGRLNILHDSDLRDATQRPLFSKKIVPSTWVDTGVGVHGQLDFNDTEVNYSAYLINGLSDSSESIDDISQKNGIRKARPNFKTDNNGDKAIAAHLSVSPKLGLEIGSSLYSGAYDDGGKDRVTMIGFDGYYKTGRYELISEFANINIKNGAVEKMMGAYGELRAHVLQSWLKNKLSYLKNPVITLFTRHEYVNTDVDNDYITYRHMIGMNFRPTETVSYKLEYYIDNYEQPGNDSKTSAVAASLAVGF